MTAPQATRAVERSGLLRLVLGFPLVFAVLNLAYLHFKTPYLKPWVIDLLTVRPAAWLADSMLAVPVVARGHTLLAGDTRISVLNGCEGVDAMLMLVAAVALQRASWRAKLWGVVLGVGWVYLANQLRIVALVWARLEAPQFFGPGHGVLGPLTVIALTVLYFLWWTRRITPAGG
jgi:exosortase/archaeosortase family protein